MPNPLICFLIDDDIDDQEIFQIAAKDINENIICHFANDGIEALSKINSDKNFKPHYIFLDLNMPRMNGTQCLAELKKIERIKNIPVIIYSTSSDPKFINETKKLGATDYLVKPPSIKELTKMLQNVFDEIPVDGR